MKMRNIQLSRKRVEKKTKALLAEAFLRRRTTKAYWEKKEKFKRIHTKQFLRIRDAKVYDFVENKRSRICLRLTARQMLEIENMIFLYKWRIKFPSTYRDEKTKIVWKIRPSMHKLIYLIKTNRLFRINDLYIQTLPGSIEVRFSEQEYLYLFMAALKVRESNVTVSEHFDQIFEKLKRAKEAVERKLF